MLEKSEFVVEINRKKENLFQAVEFLVILDETVHSKLTEISWDFYSPEVLNFLFPYLKELKKNEET
jgi:hypothetical protein